MFGLESKIYRMLRKRDLKIFIIGALKLLKQRYLFVRMDTNNFCNLACTMCPFSATKEGLKKEIMSFALYQKIAKDIFPLIRYLCLSCGTEPLMTPGFENYLTLAKGYKVPFISFCTNGMLLDKEFSRKIIEIGISEVIISIDASKKGTFEKIRAGAKYDTIFKNISDLVELKKELKSKLPNLRFNCVMQRENFNELEGIVRLAKKYDVSTVQFRHIVSVDNLRTKDKSLFNIKRLYNDKIDEIIKLSNEIGVNILYPKKYDLSEHAAKQEEREECAFPWFYMYIDHRGRAKHCPFFKGEISDFGMQNYSDYLKSPKLLYAKNNLKRNTAESCIKHCKSQGGVVDVNSEIYYE